MTTAFNSVVSMSLTSESRNEGVPTTHCDMYMALTESGVAIWEAAGFGGVVLATVASMPRTYETRGAAAAAAAAAPMIKIRPPARRTTLLRHPVFFIFMRTCVFYRRHDAFRFLHVP